MGIRTKTTKMIVRYITANIPYVCFMFNYLYKKKLTMIYWYQLEQKTNKKRSTYKYCGMVYKWELTNEISNFIFCRVNKPLWKVTCERYILYVWVVSSLRFGQPVWCYVTPWYVNTMYDCRAQLTEPDIRLWKECLNSDDPNFVWLLQKLVNWMNYNMFIERLSSVFQY